MKNYKRVFLFFYLIIFILSCDKSGNPQIANLSNVNLKLVIKYYNEINTISLILKKDSFFWDRGQTLSKIKSIEVYNENEEIINMFSENYLNTKRNKLGENFIEEFWIITDKEIFLVPKESINLSREKLKLIYNKD